MRFLGLCARLAHAPGEGIDESRGEGVARDEVPGFGAPHPLTPLLELLRRDLEISFQALELAQWREDGGVCPIVAALERELAHLVRVCAGGVGGVAEGLVDERPLHRRQGPQRWRALYLPLDRNGPVDQLAPPIASAVATNNRSLGQRGSEHRRIARLLGELDRSVRVHLCTVESAGPPGNPRPGDLDVCLERDVSFGLHDRLREQGLAHLGPCLHELRQAPQRLSAERAR